MQLDPVQEGARAKGQLVFAMRQSEQTKPLVKAEGPYANNEAAKGGYCMGLSVHWMQLVYAGKNLPFSTITRVYDGIDWVALDIQAKYLDQPKADDGTFGWKGSTSLRGMRVCLGLKAEQWVEKPTGKFFCNAVRKAWGCYGVTLSGKGGQHAIAIRHARDNTFHLFDPNFGHFAVKWVDKFRPFLDWYLAETGYDEIFASGNVVLGVRPPHQ
jgi:hypothetical protein